MPPTGVVHVCGEPGDRRIPRADAFCEETPQVVEALTRLGRDDKERWRLELHRAARRRATSAARVKVSRRQKIRLVQNDRHRLAVRGERAQVAGRAARRQRTSAGPRPRRRGRRARGRGRPRARCAASTESKSGRSSSTRPSAPSAARRWRLGPPTSRGAGPPVAPDAQPGRRRRRAAAADAGELLPGECVEERRLPGAGRAGESHDRRLERQGPAAPPPARRRHGPADGLPVEPSLR